ncbi:MAG: hypothetical protein IPK71_20580 [Myxococcales bacterium]|nr:hypothetical protein [Myxococcales bacterium]
MTPSRLSLVLAASLAVSAVSSQARADGPSAAQDAQAEDLFQRAKALMAQSRYREACPLLAESYRLAGGGGTLQNLAVCHEEEGKVAFAYNRFVELRALSLKANRQDRVKLAEEHLAKLKDRLSRLEIHFVGGKAPGTLVYIDGDAYGETSLSAGVLVNTGTRTVRIEAPGKKPLELKKRIEDEGKTDRLEVPKLEDLPVAKAPPPGPAAGPSLEELDRVAGQRALRTTGFVIGGLGIATGIAGGVFGVLAITKNQAAADVCADTGDPAKVNAGPFDDDTKTIRAGGGCFAPKQSSTNPDLVKANGLRDDARTFANVANVLVPVGVVALGVGAYLVIRGSQTAEPPKKPERASVPRGAPVRASLTPSFGGLQLQGEFQ